MKAARYWSIDRDEVLILVIDTSRNDRSHRSMGMGFRIMKADYPEVFGYFEALEKSFQDPSSEEMP